MRLYILRRLTNYKVQPTLFLLHVGHQQSICWHVPGSLTISVWVANTSTATWKVWFHQTYADLFFSSPSPKDVSSISVSSWLGVGVSKYSCWFKAIQTFAGATTRTTNLPGIIHLSLTAQYKSWWNTIAPVVHCGDSDSCCRRRRQQQRCLTHSLRVLCRTSITYSPETA